MRAACCTGEAAWSAAVEALADPRQVVYYVASVIPLSGAVRQEILELAGGTPLDSNSPPVAAVSLLFVDPDRALAGTSEGWVHRTSSARTSAADTVWPSSRPRKGFVSSVAFDPQNPDVVYAT